MRIFKYVQQWQCMVLLNIFTIAIINTLSSRYLGRWNVEVFIWSYFIINVFMALIYAYWDMPKKKKI